MNIKFKFSILSVVLLSLFLFPTKTLAAKFETGDYTLDKGSIVEEDLYVGGDNITIKGVVDGDLIATGENVTIEGTVTGDTYAFGNIVDIRGNVYGTLYTGASNVSITGTIGRNAYIGSMVTTINSTIGSDLLIGSGSVKLSGEVGDDVRIGAGQIVSDAKVKGDFLLSSETYTVSEDDITGQLVATTTNTEEIKETAKDIDWKETFSALNISTMLIGFVGMYIVGALFIYLAPVKTLNIQKEITGSWTSFFKSLGIGLLTVFVVPIPLILLTISLVGIPVAVLITGVMIFLFVFATLWGEIAVGDKLLELFNQKDSNKYLSLLVGRFLTVLVKLIPYMGVVYSSVLTVTAIGAVVGSKINLLMVSKKGKK